MAEPPLTYFTCTLGQAATITETYTAKPKTINEFLKLQAELHPKSPAAGFPLPTVEKWGYEVFCFEDIYKGSVSVATEFQPFISYEAAGSSKCVALLCPSSIDFLFAWLALMKLGVSVLLVAPQCQPAAILSLCQSCNVSIMFYDSIYSSLAYSAVKQTESNDSNVIARVLPWQGRSQDITTIIRAPTKDSTFIPVQEPSEYDVAYIHHSSGTSTGIPKPIPQTHRAGCGVLPRLDGHDAATFTTTPLYHGGIADSFRAWTSNAMIWLFPGATLPITPQNILSCISSASKAHREVGTPPIKYFSSVPYVLQMLAVEPSGISMLQEMELVGVGGAALSAKIGDHLVESGVNLISRFGSAECGFLLSSHRNYATDKEWQYLRLPPSVVTLWFERIEGADEEMAELIVKKGWPHMAKTNRADNSYATSDLLLRHREIKNAWKYHGRSDSQITLLTGKKFDPTIWEDELRSELEFIRDAVVFGNGRQYPGALVFLSYSPNQEDEENLWSAVAGVNERLESHCRVGRSMIEVITDNGLGPEKSSKGTILRGPTEDTFTSHIEHLYHGRCSTEPASNHGNSDKEIKSAVCRIINETLGFNLSDTDDFYRHGVDSIKATQIRSKIERELLVGTDLPWNVVYDCGNIQRLSEILMRMRNLQSEVVEDEAHEMLELAKQYSVFDALAKNVKIKEPKSQTIVLTGATGALGAHILDALRGQHSVSQIICLVRAKDECEARQKVLVTLSKRKIYLLDAANKVKCVPFSLDKADLGLSQEMLESIKNDATCFLHAAWAVNFSLPLRSFVYEHIAGLHSLLNLMISCKSEARFVFCSSTASVIRHPSPVQEALSESPTDADTLGYSRSKWVAEAICASASRIEGMEKRVNIVRVGQLTGDTRNGIWNVNEAWPLMLSTIRELKCLPRITQILDWLPLDVAAAAVVDIAFQDNAKFRHKEMVYHVVNCSSKHTWVDLLGWVGSMKDFEIVDPNVWLEKLDGLRDHPAKRLLWLWQKAFGTAETQHEKRNIAFDTEQAMEVSQAMREFGGLDEMLVRNIWLWLEQEMNTSGEPKGLT